MAEEKITKKKSKVVVVIIVAVLAVVALGVAIVLLLNGKKSYRSVKIESYEGEVELKRAGEKQKVFQGIKLIPDDKVKTHEDAEAVLLVDSDKHIVAEENTCFTIESTGNENSGLVNIHLEYGHTLITIDHKLSDASEFEVTTPNASCSVRGTTFSVSYDPDIHTTIVKVEEGVVKVRGAGDSAKLEAGDWAIITDEELIVNPKEDSAQGSADEKNGNGGADGNDEGNVGNGDADVAEAWKNLVSINEEGYVVFGAYEQDGNTANGAEPIEWQILGEDENGVLLVSRYILDKYQFDPAEENIKVTWEQCTLRRWMNQEFLSNAFTEEEQELIIHANITTPDNRFYGSEGGNDTVDQVFCLSIEDILKYYKFNRYYEADDPDSIWLDCGYSQDLMVPVTDAAIAKGTYVYEMTAEDYEEHYRKEGYPESQIGKTGGEWWLRSPGDMMEDENYPEWNEYFGLHVYPNGFAGYGIGPYAGSIYDSYWFAEFGVRPAIYLPTDILD